MPRHDLLEVGSAQNLPVGRDAATQIVFRFILSLCEDRGDRPTLQEENFPIFHRPFDVTRHVEVLFHLRRRISNADEENSRGLSESRTIIPKNHVYLRANSSHTLHQIIAQAKFLGVVLFQRCVESSAIG